MSESSASDFLIEPALYLIPVPLGEIGDAPVDRVLPSYNTLIVRGIKHFIVENKRTACRFLKSVDKSIDIDSLCFYELNEHTPGNVVFSYLSPLEKQSLPMGVLSEAGCPAVADPGAIAVEVAHNKGLKVIPLVGPSSILMSVMASGFNGQSFAFNGYLPVKQSERTSRIRQLEGRAWRENQTQVFIEAPYRNEKLFSSILSCCRKETRLCVAVNLTCPSEHIESHSIQEWKKREAPFMQKVPAIFLLYRG